MRCSIIGVMYSGQREAVATHVMYSSATNCVLFFTVSQTSFNGFMDSQLGPQWIPSSGKTFFPPATLSS